VNVNTTPAFLSKVFDVGDLPLLTFGNCELKSGVIKWPLKLYMRFCQNQEKNTTFYVFLSCCARFLGRWFVMSTGGGAHRPISRGGCVGKVKCKIKNNDTVHNAPCVEKRSTFLQKHAPPFHFLPTGLAQTRT